MFNQEEEQATIQRLIAKDCDAKIQIEKGEHTLSLKEFDYPGVPEVATVNILETNRVYNPIQDPNTGEVIGLICINKVKFEYNDNTWDFSFVDGGVVTNDGQIWQSVGDIHIDWNDVEIDEDAVYIIHFLAQAIICHFM